MHWPESARRSGHRALATDESEYLESVRCLAGADPRPKYHEKEYAEQVLAAGQADMCGMTRAMISDPEMANKAKAGRLPDIRACIACNQACIGHYHAGYSISCIQNPAAGRELRLGSIAPAARPGRVDDQKTDAAETAVPRLDRGERKGGADDGIDDAAASLQQCRPGLGCGPVLRGDNSPARDGRRLLDQPILRRLRRHRLGRALHLDRLPGRQGAPAGVRQNRPGPWRGRDHRDRRCAAGGPPPGDFRNVTRDDWIRALDSNMLTPIFLIRAVIDGMIERRFGRIVNITTSGIKSLGNLSPTRHIDWRTLRTDWFRRGPVASGRPPQRYD